MQFITNASYGATILSGDDFIYFWGAIATYVKLVSYIFRFQVEFCQQDRTRIINLSAESYLI